ncbi:MAG: hypothetical protein WB116_06775 [Candidatus Dormiibacterota bacterium]
MNGAEATFGNGRSAEMPAMALAILAIPGVEASVLAKVGLALAAAASHGTAAVA